MFWIPLAVGAGVGLLRNQMQASAAADERKRQAAITRYSPWTNMKGQTVQDPDMLGNVLGGAVTGAALGQSAGAAAPEAGAVGPAGAGATKYSLMGDATNSAPFGLMSNPSDASRFGLMSGMGSAGAMGGAKPGMNPWMGFDQFDPFSVYNRGAQS